MILDNPMPELCFTKAHGLGNDFIIIDLNSEDMKQNLSIDTLRANLDLMQDRRYGIGCDQLIILAGEQATFLNRDGSSAQFCGNGSRVLIKYLLNHNRKPSFMTESGPIHGYVEGSKVYIEYPQPRSIQKENEYYKVDIGNKHIIIFDSDPNPKTPVKPDWPYLLSIFDNTIYNLMYLSLVQDRWHMAIHEIGAGETYACGSGAMAATLAIWTRQNAFQTDSPLFLEIQMTGGSLQMLRQENKFYQAGPAEIVYKGVITLSN